MNKGMLFTCRSEAIPCPMSCKVIFTLLYIDKRFSRKNASTNTAMAQMAVTM